MLVTSLFEMGLNSRFYKQFLPDKEFAEYMNIDEKKVSS
jgi:hypothetical protein